MSITLQEAYGVVNPTSGRLCKVTSAKGKQLIASGLEQTLCYINTTSNRLVSYDSALAKKFRKSQVSEEHEETKQEPEHYVETANDIVNRWIHTGYVTSFKKLVKKASKKFKELRDVKTYVHKIVKHSGIRPKKRDMKKAADKVIKEVGIEKTHWKPIRDKLEAKLFKTNDKVKNYVIGYVQDLYDNEPEERQVIMRITKDKLKLTRTVPEPLPEDEQLPIDPLSSLNIPTTEIATDKDFEQLERYNRLPDSVEMPSLEISEDESSDDDDDDDDDEIQVQDEAPLPCCLEKDTDGFEDFIKKKPKIDEVKPHQDQELVFDISMLFDDEVQDVEVEDIIKLPEFKCSICLEQTSETKIKLDCGHEFHADCIKQWFSIENTCCLCKVKVNQYTDENGKVVILKDKKQKTADTTTIQDLLEASEEFGDDDGADLWNLQNPAIFCHNCGGYERYAEEEWNICSICESHHVHDHCVGDLRINGEYVCRNCFPTAEAEHIRQNEDPDYEPCIGCRDGILNQEAHTCLDSDDNTDDEGMTMDEMIAAEEAKALETLDEIVEEPIEDIKEDYELKELETDDEEKEEEKTAENIDESSEDESEDELLFPELSNESSTSLFSTDSSVDLNEPIPIQEPEPITDIQPHNSGHLELIPEESTQESEYSSDSVINFTTLDRIKAMELLGNPDESSEDESEDELLFPSLMNDTSRRVVRLDTGTTNNSLFNEGLHITAVEPPKALVEMTTIDISKANESPDKIWQVDVEECNTVPMPELELPPTQESENEEETEEEGDVVEIDWDDEIINALDELDVELEAEPYLPVKPMPANKFRDFTDDEEDEIPDF